MILSSEDLPEPLAPRTPILAPGNIEMLMPRSTSLSGGWTRRRLRIVKMNWTGMPPTLTARCRLRLRGSAGRGPPPGGLAGEHRTAAGDRLRRAGPQHRQGDEGLLLPHP